MKILVTGGSGNVGKEVVYQLKSRQISFQVGVRNPANANAIEGVETVQFDFLDPSTYAPAVIGGDAVFLLRPPAIANTKQTLNVFLDVAWVSGVSQVVFISVAGAGENQIVPHHAVEQHLRSGPAGWTILRPGFFAQNIGDAYRQDIVNDNRIFLPAGSGRVAFIDVRDLAEVAVNALTLFLLQKLPEFCLRNSVVWKSVPFVISQRVSWHTCGTYHAEVYRQLKFWFRQFCMWGCGLDRQKLSIRPSPIYSDTSLEPSVTTFEIMLLCGIESCRLIEIFSPP
jgi:NAD(P)H-binding